MSDTTGSQIQGALIFSFVSARFNKCVQAELVAVCGFFFYLLSVADLFLRGSARSETGTWSNGIFLSITPGHAGAVSGRGPPFAGSWK